MFATRRLVVVVLNIYQNDFISSLKVMFLELLPSKYESLAYFLEIVFNIP